ncbi:MAG: glycosyltransferase family A protein, partial [Methanobrevibacter sp.]|nr:glycosyltransferase family A protein [Methanobrevibacter sp.]
MSEIKFSIIIPANDSTEGVEKTLNSLINQTLSFENNVEAIILDKPLNHTREVCEKYIDRYPLNVKFFETEMLPPHNIGLENTEGEYILFLEANDYLSKRTLEDVSDFIKNNPNLDLVTIPIYYYKNNRLEHYLDYPIKNSSAFNLNEIPEPVQLLGPSTFIKKESIDETKFINDYNKYNTFLSQISVDYPNLGICKDGNYFIENIDEKTLPTEDISFNRMEYEKFIEENLNNLIEKNENKFGEVTKSMQYSLLNQLK